MKHLNLKVMKRTTALLLLSLALCTALPVVAYDGEFGHVRIGVGGGLNAGYTTSFNTENLYQLESYSGFFLGPQLDLRLTHRLGIGMAAFLQKDELSFGFMDDDLVLTSFQIPVNLSLALLRTAIISLLLEGGPQFMYMVDEKKVQYDYGSLTFSDYALSLNMGVVAEVASSIRVGARINIPTSGFADIKDTVSDIDSFKMSTLQITVAILF
jgi:hypothetical protein